MISVEGRVESGGGSVFAIGQGMGDLGHGDGLAPLVLDLELYERFGVKHLEEERQLALTGMRVGLDTLVLGPLALPWTLTSSCAEATAATASRRAEVASDERMRFAVLERVCRKEK